MAAALVVVVIVGVFFAAGLMVGGIVVIALPMLRDRRSARIERREPGGDTVQPENNCVTPDDRPRYSGDADRDYSNR